MPNDKLSKLSTNLHRQLNISRCYKTLIMNRKEIEEANRETGRILGLILKINGIAIVAILTAYIVLNILGMW